MQSTRILVADDSRTVRVSLNRILTAADYQVLLASDGREAVDLARLHEPQLAVLDIQMPEMDGYTACEEILSQATIPIIFLTKDPGNHLAALGDQLGAYIPKPAQEVELLSTIKQLLANAELETCAR